ncbi:TPA: antibiotic biosynthesis monooxygenase [Klebsiella pneumoniae]|nr:antibiotic biosynthesis monooxygenase [Klebsiella pneumoniae]
MAQQKSVTLVISHLLDPQHSQRYEEWLGKIMPIAAEFPGHLGANVIRPAAGQNLWSVIIRFDTLEHLYAWTQSETRRQLVAEIAPLLTEGDRTEVRTEPAFWFTPPTVTGMLLPSLKGSLLLHLINDACVVALVVWFWMPIVTRLFAGWLKKN